MTMRTENKIIDRYCSNINIPLLKAVSCSNLSPETAEALTRNIDVDRENACYLALLSKAGMTMGYEGFRPDTVERFKGIFRFHQVRRAFNLTKYCELFKMLDSHKIDFICGWITAFDFQYLRSDFQPHSVFEIVVHSCDRDTAAELIDSVLEPLRQIDKEPERQLPFENNIRICDNEEVWKRTACVERYGMNVRTLSLTDMLALYGEILCKEAFGRSASNVDTVSNCLLWLYEFGSVLDGEPIDLQYISKHYPPKVRRRIRFLLAYAYRAYGYADRLRSLRNCLPSDIPYMFFLLGKLRSSRQKKDNKGRRT